MVAAKQGGGDPNANLRLRLAIEAARAASMPKDNISRAIERATSASSETLEEITYEGYGPGGSAIIVQSTTDNRNRTAAEVRSTFSKHGGTLGETGSVGWMFRQQGMIDLVPATLNSTDEISLAAIEAGANDIEEDEGHMLISTDPANLETLSKALGHFGTISAEAPMVASVALELNEDHGATLMRLLEGLEDLEDTDHVYTNANFSF